MSHKLWNLLLELEYFDVLFVDGRLQVEFFFFDQLHLYFHFLYFPCHIHPSLLILFIPWFPNLNFKFFIVLLSFDFSSIDVIGFVDIIGDIDNLLGQFLHLSFIFYTCLFVSYSYFLSLSFKLEICGLKATDNAISIIFNGAVW